MPTSPPELISMVVPTVMATAVRNGVKSVLDLGCGAGLYGALMRHYLDTVHNRLKPAVRIIGVEGYEGFKTPNWGNYTKVHVGLIQDYLRRENERFDVVLLLDVIEHFPWIDLEARTDGRRILQAAYERTDVMMLVTSPLTPRQQWQPEKPWETELQEHRSFVKPEQVNSLFPRVRIVEGQYNWLALIYNEFLEIN